MKKWLLVFVMVSLGALQSAYSQNKVCPVRAVPDTFNFGRDKFNLENQGDGVRLRFIAGETLQYGLVVVSYPGQNIFKSVYYCGSDSSCASPLFKSDSIPVQYLFNAVAGSAYYFSIKPTNTLSYDKNFLASVGTICTLSIASDGNGSVLPSGAVSAPAYFPIALKAVCGSPLVYLDRWAQTAGVFDLSAAADTLTTVKLTGGNATVTARFLPRPINTVGFVKDTFNFTRDGKRPQLGTLFQFTPTETDTYSVEIGDPLSSAYKQLVWCGADSTFASTASSATGYTFSYGFKATAGQKAYFKVIPYYQSDYNDSFTVFMGRIYKLKITHTGAGATSPADSSWVKPGVLFPISATPANQRSYFTRWSTVSGKPVISDSLGASASVRLDSGSVTLQAVFADKQIFSFDSTLDIFTYNVYTKLPQKLLVFTALSADSFAIVFNSAGYYTHSKSLNYYGTDSLFNTLVASSGSSYYETVMGIRATAANQKMYFRIAPVFTSDSTDSFCIRAARIVTLHVAVNASGRATTVPADSIRIPQRSNTTVSTAPTSYRYYFQQWQMTSGSGVIADSSDSATAVKIDNNGTITALYQPRTIFPIGFVRDTFNFSTDGGRASGGVLLSFTATKADTFLIELGDSGYSYYYLNISYYGTDNTFPLSNVPVIANGYGSFSYGFVTHAAGETYYFRVSPSGYSSPNAFYADIKRVVQLKTAPNYAGRGTTTPDSVSLPQNSAYRITAAPSTYRYYLNSWHVTSGSSKIADTTEAATMDTLDTVNTTVTANFEPRPILPLRSIADTFNFTRDGKDPSGGVLLSFTAPRPDTFIVTIGDSGFSSYKNFSYYAGDSAFPIVGTFDTTALNGSYSFAFIATAPQQKFFFRVSPYSVYYNNHAFWAYVDSALILTLKTDGNGTTTPSGYMPVVRGSNSQISAEPVSAFYYFDRWRIESGRPKIVDSALQTTTVRLDSGNATIRADFKRRIVHPITFIPNTFQYAIDGGGTGEDGILFSFTAPSADSFCLVGNTRTGYPYKYLYYYAADSTFSTVPPSQTLYNDSPKPIYAAAPGQTLYFRIAPYSGYYGGDSVIVFMERFAKLTLLADGGGTTVPPDSLRAPRGATRSIRAVPLSSLYYFEAWSRLTTGAVFQYGDTTALTATVRIDSAQNTIKANFGEKTLLPITFSRAVYGYFAGANENSDGPVFVFTAPSAGRFAVGVDTAGPYAYNYLYYYGTDPLFSAIDTSLYHSAGMTSLAFTASATGEKHYFRVAPSSPSYASYQFALRAYRFVKLTVMHNFGGTTNPADTARLQEQLPYSIQALPNTVLSSFWKWNVPVGNEAKSNNVRFADSMSAVTTVTIDSGDATIKANFIAKEIYPITFLPAKYRYDVHGGTSSDKSVAFKFTSASADSFTIVVKKGAYSQTIYFYGTHGLFDTVVTSKTLNASASDTSFGFRAKDADQIYYFRIAPSSSTTDSFTIRAIGYYTLTATSDCPYTLTPAKPTMAVMNTPIAISAVTTDSLYAFNRWTVEKGSATIAVDTLSSTTVTLSSGSATVKAVCSLRPHDTLRVTDDGNGIAIPLQPVLALTGKETTVASYPNSGYIFSAWQTIAGSAQITNPTSSKTQVKLPGGAATVKAVFVPDPLAKPTVKITTIDLSHFQDVCITALPRSENGRTITGLDSSAFTLQQDSIPVSFQVKSFQEVKSISVSMVIDQSLTMGLENRLVNAKAAARDFVSRMTPADRAAIISFSDVDRVVQTMTSDTALLGKAIDGIIADGQTAIIDGAYTGIDQLTGESNARVMIIFSDGQENASKQHNLAQVIAAAKAKQVVVYSIAVGADAFVGADAVLKPLADSAKGNFFFARSASDLTRLYQQIKTDIEAQYVLCYRSPDTLLNGQTHQIKVTVLKDGKNAVDTASWFEGNVNPPVVTLTASTKSLFSLPPSSGAPLTISATVTSTAALGSVRLKYRIIDSVAKVYAEAVMTNVGATYSAVIPAGNVKKPGIEFYIVAVDIAGNRGCSPNALNPETSPWVISIGNTGPVIFHTPVTVSLPQTPITIAARVEDSDGVKAVMLVYKKRTEIFDRTDTMRLFSADSFKTIIPANLVTEDGIQYGIKAFDVYGTSSRVPDTSWYFIRINKCPVLTVQDTTVKRKSAVSLLISAVDPDGGVPILTADSTTMPKGALFSSLGNGTGRFIWQTTCADTAGSYGIIFSASDGQCDKSATLHLTLADSADQPVFSSAAEYSTKENSLLAFSVVAADCRGSLLKLTADSLPKGASFDSAGNGKGTFTWSTDCRSGGVYRVIFSASNSKATARQVVRISVADSNCCLPDLKVSAADTVIGPGSQLQIRATAFDCDSTVSRMEVRGLPDSARFSDNGNSTGAFVWTPRDTGLFEVTFIAIDGASPKDSVKIKVNIHVGELPVRALLFDRNGEGHLDRISLVWPTGSTLRPQPPKINELLDTVMIVSLSGKKIFLSPINLIEDGDSIHIVLDEHKTGELETGWESAYVKLTSIRMTDRDLPSRVTSYVDSAGPVIKSAVYAPGSSGTPGRLIVGFSEPVQWKQTDDQPADFLNYFTLSDKPDPAAFSGLAARHIQRSTDSVVISLANGLKVRPLLDSVSLRPYDELGKAHCVDAGIPGRTPAANNRKMAVQLFTGGIPVVAAFYDANGEGRLDRMTLTWPEWAPLKDILIEPGDLIRSIKLTNYAGVAKSFFASTLVKTGPLTLEAALSEQSQDTLTTGWLTAAIELTDARVTSLDAPSTVMEIDDSAGPVIQGATFVASRAVNGNKPMLRIVMSEPVFLSEGPSQDMFGYFSEGLTTPSAAAFVSTSSSDRVHAGRTLLIPLAEGFSVHPYNDSINLQPCGSGKLLTDSANGNCPHPLNRKVRIDYEGAVSATAVLYDTKGEGQPDLLHLRWALPFTLDSEPKDFESLFDSISFVKYDGKRQNIVAAESIEVNNAGIACVLPGTPGGPSLTGWKSATLSINGAMTAHGFSIRADSIIDSAGPVVESAQVHRFNQAGKGPDTLSVYFDEPLSVPKVPKFVPSDLLLFFREGTETSAFAGVDSMTAIVVGKDSIMGVSIVLTNGFVVASERDSVSLRRNDDALRRVTDVSDARNPPQSMSRRAPVKSISGPPSSEPVQAVFACENPFTPGISRIPPSPWPSMRALPSTGTRIEAQLKNGVEVSKVEAKVDIYDPVGNVVLRSKKMIGMAKSLYYHWDGRNERGMFVSQGMYLAVVTATTGSSGEQVLRVKIGVKRTID
jgi:VWFA-related protein